MADDNSAPSVPTWPRHILAADVLNGRTDDDVNVEIVEALLAYYPNQLFWYNDTLVCIPKRIARDVTAPFIHVSRAYMDLLLNPCATIKKDVRPPKFESPSLRLCDELLAGAEGWAPHLRGVVKGPYLAPDGSRVVTVPGYDDETGYYNRCFVEIPDVTLEPLTGDDRSDAACNGHALMSEFFDYLYGWFPLGDVSSMAHTLGLFLLPLLRPAISGPTPAHLIVAPEGNLGKTDLAQMALFTGFGEVAKAIPVTTDPYQLGSLLADQPSYLLFDNQTTGSVLGNAELDNILTSYRWGGRLVRQGTSSTVPVRAVWVFTGNHIEMTNEMASRSVEIRLSTAERDTTMKRWKAPDAVKPLAWIAQNRGLVLGVLVAMIRRWIALGSPRHEQRLGKYVEWSDMVGGVISTVDALIGDDQFSKGWLLEETRPVGVDLHGWRVLFDWWTTDGLCGWLATSAVMDTLDGLDALTRVVTTTEARSKHALGRLLAKHAADRTELAPGWTLECSRDKHKKHNLYRPARSSVL